MRGCGGRLGGLLSSVKCSCREGSEVCEGVGKQKGCDEIETVDVSLALQPLSVCGGDSCNSAFMTDISPRRICREVSFFFYWAVIELTSEFLASNAECLCV